MVASKSLLVSCGGPSPACRIDEGSIRERLIDFRYGSQRERKTVVHVHTTTSNDNELYYASSDDGKVLDNIKQRLSS